MGTQPTCFGGCPPGLACEVVGGCSGNCIMQ
jgi:hypothetical protein